MHEDEQGRAGDRETAEHECHARRQRGCRDQHRSEEQESKRILQAPGKEQEDRELGDIEPKKPSRPPGLEPLHRGKADAQRDIEPGRKRNDEQAGPDRKIEIKAPVHNEDGSGLTNHREPAQPNECIEATLRPMG